MFLLELSPAEVATLREVLTSYLGDLRMEVADTDSYDLRQELKAKEEAIRALVDRLAAAA